MDSQSAAVYMTAHLPFGMDVLSPLRAEIVTDNARLGELLRSDPITAAYMLGDLDEAYRDFCTWYGAGRSDELEGIVLVYTGLSVAAVLSFGAPDAIAEIFAEYSDQLPGRAIVHFPPAHLDAVGRVYGCDCFRPMVRMGLVAERFQPWQESDPAEPPILGLRHRDTAEIMALFEHYPDNFFEPTQLGTGHYYGIRVDGRLVSVAGVHVVSERERVACLGNIVTHPDFRSRGLSTRCTSHLCQRLIDSGIHLFALNVFRQNRSAIRVYERLGFAEHMTYLEGLTQQRPVNGPDRLC